MTDEDFWSDYLSGPLDPDDKSAEVAATRFARRLTMKRYQIQEIVDYIETAKHPEGIKLSNIWVRLKAMTNEG